MDALARQLRHRRATSKMSRAIVPSRFSMPRGTVGRLISKQVTVEPGHCIVTRIAVPICNGQAWESPASVGSCLIHELSAVDVYSLARNKRTAIRC